MVEILMMSVKLGTLDVLKITVFWKMGYDVIMLVRDVTNEILSIDSNYVVRVIMWPNFGI